MTFYCSHILTFHKSLGRLYTSNNQPVHKPDLTKSKYNKPKKPDPAYTYSLDTHKSNCTLTVPIWL